MTDNRNPTGLLIRRRAFIAAAGGVGDGFVLYALLPGGTRVALARHPWLRARG